jgi:hypothetical protein
MNFLMKNALWSGIVVLAVVSTSPQIADATVLKDLQLEDLVRESTSIVEGTVAGAVVHRLDKGPIVTDISVRVDATLKGEVVPEITVRLQGGRIGNIAQRMAGQASFHEGERVLLFLAEDGQLAYTVGMELGKFEITMDPRDKVEHVHRTTTVPVASPDAPTLLRAPSTKYEGALLTAIRADISKLLAP